MMLRWSPEWRYSYDAYISNMHRRAEERKQKSKELYLQQRKEWMDNMNQQQANMDAEAYPPFVQDWLADGETVVQARYEYDAEEENEIDLAVGDWILVTTPHESGYVSL